MGGISGVVGGGCSVLSAVGGWYVRGGEICGVYLSIVSLPCPLLPSPTPFLYNEFLTPILFVLQSFGRRAAGVTAVRLWRV